MIGKVTDGDFRNEEFVSVEEEKYIELFNGRSGVSKKL